MLQSAFGLRRTLTGINHAVGVSVARYATLSTPAEYARMSAVSPSDPVDRRVPLFATGFRPFFLGAAVLGVLGMGEWTAVWSGRLTLPLGPLTPAAWHAHEMIYGYALAVVAGFLLTAARNWTGRPTAHGPVLAILFGVWLAARLAFAGGLRFAPAMAVLDLAFAVGLLVAVAAPIIRAGLWRQAGVLAKLGLLGAGNAVFWLGVFGVLADGVRWGLLGGLLLLVSLVLTIGARVLPGFIERGVPDPVSLPACPWTTRLNVLLILPFFANVLFVGHAGTTVVLAAALCAINALRLARWHVRAIWTRPLLWGLWLSFAGITLGFGLYALAAAGRVPETLALHAFAVGGVGLATLSMMARVALGHTGRDIHAPPRTVAVCVTLLCAATVARVLVPLAAPAWYVAAVQLSQGLWMAAFLLFAVSYVPVLTRARVDGEPG